MRELEGALEYPKIRSNASLKVPKNLGLVFVAAAKSETLVVAAIGATTSLTRNSRSTFQWLDHSEGSVGP
jgi:hypothetical protein